MSAEKRGVGIRIKSRYHEIEPDSSEAFLYFAEMCDAVADVGDDLAGADDKQFTSENAKSLTSFMRELFEPDDEQLEIYTEGELYFGDGRLELRYRESHDITGMGDSVTSISFDEKDRGIITITRGGDVYSALVLERGIRHTCAYNTADLPLLIYTTAKRIKNELSETGGTLDMIYTVEAQSGTAQYNRVTVTVTVHDTEDVCPG